MSEQVCETEHRADEPGVREAEAVLRAVRGEAGAFDELVRRYQRRAVGLAYRLVGDVHAAADIAQDAFVRAYRGLGSLQDPQRFAPWLMRIVSNLSLNYRRSRKAALSVPLESAGEGAEGFRRASDAAPLTSPEPFDGMDLPELSAAVAAALQQLPEKQRMALTLFSVEGMSQKEVARLMSCSVELVKWNVYQARKTMKRLLASFLE